MPFHLTMPKLSPTMEEGTITKWHKKEGDFVEAGETLLEIATDKATVEHAALDEGFLRKILVNENQSAKINQPLAIFSEKKEEAIDAFLPKEEPQMKQKVENVKEARVQEKIERKEPLFTPEPPLKEYQLPQRQKLVSPLAKKMAKEKGLDLSTVAGSGPHGRITSRDLEGAPPEAIVSFGEESPPKDLPGTYEEVPLNHLRKIIAKRLQDSKSFIPHFYVKQVICASALWELYEQLKKLQFKITLNDLILRASAIALAKHPAINSGFNSETQAIIKFKTVDIAVAVSMPDGLITPIIRHANYKNLGELSTEVRALAEKGRQGKLKESEYKGGSFCISNLGMYGITEFTAVINPPQSAILAVGAVEDKALIKEGKIVVGKTMTLTLSVDHRVIDGADAAQFLKTLQLLLEQPVALTI